MTGGSVNEADRVRVATVITRLEGSASRRPHGYGCPRQARHPVYRGRAVRRAAGGIGHRACSYRRELGQLA
jgi:hypothetical protein